MYRKVAGITAFMLVAANAAADEATYSIDNMVNTFDMEKTEPTAVGYKYWFADKAFADGKTLKLSVVNPNSATHAPHAHAEDEFFFVLEGTAEFHLDGETTTGGPMSNHPPAKPGAFNCEPLKAA